MIVHKPSLGSKARSHTNVGPIGSAVLTFIGYKQTDRQTDKQTDKPNLYIDKIQSYQLRMKGLWPHTNPFTFTSKDFEGFTSSFALKYIVNGWTK